MLVMAGHLQPQLVLVLMRGFKTLLAVFSHLEETPQQHGGMVYRQMTVVSSAKTASKRLFKQKTPLFALDFNT